MATPNDTSSGRQRRPGYPSGRGTVQNVDASSSAGTVLRITPTHPIARGSPISTHLQIRRVPQFTTGTAGTSSRRRSDSLPSPEARSIERRTGQEILTANNVTSDSSLTSLGNTSDEDEGMGRQDSEREPAVPLDAGRLPHQGQPEQERRVHFPERQGSPERQHRIVWNDAERAELQGMMDDINRRMALAENPAAPARQEFPSVRIMLIPSASVAEFLASGQVNANGHSEQRRVPGVDQTLVIYSDTVQAWTAVDDVSAVIVLPRSRSLRFLVTRALRSPILALVVFAASIAMMVWFFMTYEPAQLVLNRSLRTIVAFIKSVAREDYYAFHFSRLAATILARATRSAHAAGSRAVRYLLVAWLELAVLYLNQPHDADAERHVELRE